MSTLTFQDVGIGQPDLTKIFKKENSREHFISTAPTFHCHKTGTEMLTCKCSTKKIEKQETGGERVTCFKCKSAEE